MSDRILLLAASRDGSHNFSNWRFVPLGEQGQYRHRCVTRRWGMGREWTVKVRITSPVKTNLHGVVVDYEVCD